MAIAGRLRRNESIHSRRARYIMLQVTDRFILTSRESHGRAMITALSGSDSHFTCVTRHTASRGRRIRFEECSSFRFMKMNIQGFILSGDIKTNEFQPYENEMHDNERMRLKVKILFPSVRSAARAYRCRVEFECVRTVAGVPVIHILFCRIFWAFEQRNVMFPRFIADDRLFLVC